MATYVSSQESALKSPSDDEVISAVRTIRLQAPKLGRSKILSLLKGENQWTLSDSRLQKLMKKYEAESSSAEPISSTEAIYQPIIYPKDALAAQQKYKDESIRCFKLYSRGPYDFGVTPNADTALRINIAHKRMVEHLTKSGRPSTEADKKFVAEAWPAKLIWDYYCAAAQKAGIPKEDVGRQFDAEYGFNPIAYMKEPTSLDVVLRKAKFKEASIKMKRELLKVPEARKFVPVDTNGEPIWDEETNGEFALIVAKIDKGDGLREFGTT